MYYSGFVSVDRYWSPYYSMHYQKTGDRWST